MGSCSCAGANSSEPAQGRSSRPAGWRVLARACPAGGTQVAGKGRAWLPMPACRRRRHRQAIGSPSPSRLTAGRLVVTAVTARRSCQRGFPRRVAWHVPHAPPCGCLSKNIPILIKPAMRLSSRNHGDWLNEQACTWIVYVTASPSLDPRAQLGAESVKASLSRDQGARRRQTACRRWDSSCTSSGVLPKMNSIHWKMKKESRMKFLPSG